MAPESALRPTEHQVRHLDIEGNRARLTTYRLGERYYSAVDNVDPGATLVRTEAPTREEAERKAIEAARQEFLANPPHPGH